MAIEVESESEVWTIRHNRPEARNAMDPKSADQLVEAFEEFEKSDAKVAILTGTADCFCAGWDLKYAASLSPDERSNISSTTFQLGQHQH